MWEFCKPEIAKEQMFGCGRISKMEYEKKSICESKQAYMYNYSNGMISYKTKLSFDGGNFWD